MMTVLMAQLQASQQEALQLKAQLASPASPHGGSLFRPTPPTPTVVTATVVTPPQPTKALSGPGLTLPKAPVPLFGPVPALPDAGVAGQGERAQQAKGMGARAQKPTRIWPRPFTQTRDSS